LVIAFLNIYKKLKLKKSIFSKISKKIQNVFFEKIDFLNFNFFYILRNLITNQKKLNFFFFVKTQNNDLFISPKRKNATLEMALKSFILSKVDHQMSKS
jgi:hypothetical protein